MRSNIALVTVLSAAVAVTVAALPQETVLRVPLDYRAPGTGPSPNFSPKGTPVPLVAATAAIPDGATRPAKSGVMKVGPDERAWIPVLVAADADHPLDLCRLFVDRNRNGRFEDDGPAAIASPTQNEKTKAWWSSFNKVELTIPYAAGVAERYMVNFWIVREDGSRAPDVLRYSVASWRYGTVRVNGVEALVAAMDGDNDAVWRAGDYWSVLEASAPDGAKAVLSYNEARPTTRLMFVKDGAKDAVLQFKSFSPDGRFVDLAVVDRPTTKAADRAGDDVLRAERTRPRTASPFAWGHALDAAIAAARSGNRRVLIDFEASWCGPCKTMDEWIWTDADVASVLNARYVGVKLDGDVEKALVARFKVGGYPTMILLEPSGIEAKRAVGYLSSAEALAFLK